MSNNDFYFIIAPVWLCVAVYAVIEMRIKQGKAKKKRRTKNENRTGNKKAY